MREGDGATGMGQVEAVGAESVDTRGAGADVLWMVTWLEERREFHDIT